MFYCRLLWFAAFLFAVYGDIQSEEDIKDANLTMLELITKYGHKGEEHKAVTKDGYILTLFRMLANENLCAGQPKKPPVILQHGVLASSVDWIIIGPESGLGYLLSDSCYDVWFGNSRGNFYSRAHETLSPDSHEFWNFTWHEMGIYDCPAVIDYVLEKTGAKKAFFVGHSQGTTQYFVMDSLNPNYAKKIIAMMALAPIVFLDHTNSKLLRLIAQLEGAALDYLILNSLGIDEFLPKGSIVSQIGGQACRDQYRPTQQLVCENALFILCGFDPEETNGTMIPIIAGHTPAGAATKQLLHYGQSIKNKKFRQYDYGKLKNLKEYGKVNPPDYPLRKAKSKYALWHSNNDYFTAPQDMERLFNLLPNIIGKFQVPWEKFNHLDYNYAIHVKSLVYDAMIQLMDSLIE